MVNKVIAKMDREVDKMVKEVDKMDKEVDKMDKKQHPPLQVKLNIRDLKALHPTKENKHRQVMINQWRWSLHQLNHVEVKEVAQNLPVDLGADSQDGVMMMIMMMMTEMIVMIEIDDHVLVALAGDNRVMKMMKMTAAEIGETTVERMIILSGPTGTPERIPGKMIEMIADPGHQEGHDDVTTVVKMTDTDIMMIGVMNDASKFS